MVRRRTLVLTVGGGANMARRYYVCTKEFDYLCLYLVEVVIPQHA